TENIDGNSKQIPGGILSTGTTYYWHVDGLDVNGVSLTGPSITAEIVLPANDAISLIEPIGNVQVDNLSPSLKWAGLVGVNSYTLILSQDSNLESQLINEIVSGSEYSLPSDKGLINSMNYYWVVEAAKEDDIISSEIESFATPSIAAINLQSPADGEAVSITNPTFTWEAIEGISSYLLRIANNPEFADPWALKSGSTSFEYPGEPPLKPGVTYYWQVQPLNNQGGSIGEWSSIRNLTISVAFNVQLEAPASGEVITISNPTFQWIKIEEA
ncbi:uncharacterized protein METZ01_LOCUS422449, partial [marine metagenome]